MSIWQYPICKGEKMIFTVPEDFQGSCVLSTLNKALWKGMTVSISGPDLYAPDVKMAVKKGILVPMDEEYNSKQADLSSEAMVVNRTDKVLVLENIVLKPWASQMVSKRVTQSVAIISAEKNGFIHIISDETPMDKSKSATSKKSSKKKTQKKAIKKKTTKKKAKKGEVEEIEPKAYTPPETGEDREVTPVVWNFRDKTTAPAQTVPKTETIEVDKEEIEDVQFVDEKVEAQQVFPEKKTKKKSKKKSAKKKTKKAKAPRKTIKKKGKATKKKKVKSVEPVGKKKLPKTQADAAIELDSRGRPIDKASDTLQHLIDSLEEVSDASFVDDEQAQKRYEDRTDMD